MKLLSTIHSIALSVAMSFLLITLGCGSDPVQPALTDAEQKLTASPWRGVWQTGKGFIQINLLCEEVSFKADKSALMKICDSSATPSWKITDSAGSSLLTVGNIRYSIEKLTADSLLLRNTSTQQPYLMMRNFKGYNKVRLQRTFDNGTNGGEIGLPCAAPDTLVIPEFTFEGIGAYPNPCGDETTVDMRIGIPGTSVKITLDDGINVIPIFDNILHLGQYSISANLSNQPTGMYRLTYTVKTPDSPAAKTVHAYLFVSK